MRKAKGADLRGIATKNTKQVATKAFFGFVIFVTFVATTFVAKTGAASRKAKRREPIGFNAERQGAGV